MMERSTQQLFVHDRLTISSTKKIFSAIFLSNSKAKHNIRVSLIKKGRVSLITTYPHFVPF